MKIALWILSGLAGIVLLAAVATVVVANTGSDQIARGTTVAGVDVGGMTTAEATKELKSADLNAGLSTISVRWHGTRYTFDPEAAGLGIEAHATAKKALAESQDLGWLDRTKVMIAGEAIEPQIGDTETAVTAFVNDLPELSGEAAINATVAGTPGQPLTVTQSQAKSTLDRDELTKEIIEGVEADNPRHTPLDAPTTVVQKPSLAKNELGKIVNSDYFLYVDQTADGPLNHQSVSIYRNGKFQEMFPVATGTSVFSTDTGLRHVTDRQKCPIWTEPDTGWAPNPGKVVPGCDPANPLGSLWMGVGDGEGFHVSDVNVPSHGCIHMNEADIKKMFDMIPDGTPVYVTPLSA